MFLCSSESHDNGMSSLFVFVDSDSPVPEDVALLHPAFTSPSGVTSTSLSVAISENTAGEAIPDDTLVTDVPHDMSVGIIFEDSSVVIISGDITVGTTGLFDDDPVVVIAADDSDALTSDETEAFTTFSVSAVCSSRFTLAPNALGITPNAPHFSFKSRDSSLSRTLITHCDVIRRVISAITDLLAFAAQTFCTIVSKSWLSDRLRARLVLGDFTRAFPRLSDFDLHAGDLIFLGLALKDEFKSEF